MSYSSKETLRKTAIKQEVLSELTRLLGNHPNNFVTQATFDKIRQKVKSRPLDEQGMKDLKNSGPADAEVTDAATEGLLRDQGISDAILRATQIRDPKKLEIITPSPSRRIRLGSKATLRVAWEDFEIIMVSPIDVQINPGTDGRWTSCDSPVGFAVFGKQEGDEFRYSMPDRRVIMGLVIDVGPALELEPTPRKTHQTSMN